MTNVGGLPNYLLKWANFFFHTHLWIHVPYIFKNTCEDLMQITDLNLIFLLTKRGCKRNKGNSDRVWWPSFGNHRTHIGGGASRMAHRGGDTWAVGAPPILGCGQFLPLQQESIPDRMKQGQSHPRKIPSPAPETQAPCIYLCPGPRASVRGHDPVCGWGPPEIPLRFIFSSMNLEDEKALVWSRSSVPSVFYLRTLWSPRGTSTVPLAWVCSRALKSWVRFSRDKAMWPTEVKQAKHTTNKVVIWLIP